MTSGMPATTPNRPSPSAAQAEPEAPDHADLIVIASGPPAGVVLAASRRHALVDWARRNGAFIVEDDYDSEFRYDKEPVGVLQGLAPDRVLTIGTTSKALAPAVCPGWVVAPSLLAGAVAAEKEMTRPLNLNPGSAGAGGCRCASSGLGGRGSCRGSRPRAACWPVSDQQLPRPAWVRRLSLSWTSARSASAPSRRASPPSPTCSGDNCSRPRPPSLTLRQGRP